MLNAFGIKVIVETLENAKIIVVLLMETVRNSILHAQLERIRNA